MNDLLESRAASQLEHLCCNFILRQRSPSEQIPIHPKLPKVPPHRKNILPGQDYGIAHKICLIRVVISFMRRGVSVCGILYQCHATVARLIVISRVNFLPLDGCYHCRLFDIRLPSAATHATVCRIAPTTNLFMRRNCSIRITLADWQNENNNTSRLFSHSKYLRFDVIIVQ